MHVRKVGDGVYEARDGDRRVGGYEIAADGGLRLDGGEELRAHALETARKLGHTFLTLNGERLAIPGPHLEGDETTRRTLRDFFDGERLKEIPSSLPRRRVVLEWLATRFEPGVRYAEAEVNQILLQHHPDFAMTRRYLVDWGLLERADGRYWRASQAFK